MNQALLLAVMTALLGTVHPASTQNPSVKKATLEKSAYDVRSGQRMQKDMDKDVPELSKAEPDVGSMQ